MVTTRSKDSQGKGTEAPAEKDAAAGTKHKIASANEPEHGKRQKTLEETLDQKKGPSKSKTKLKQEPRSKKTDDDGQSKAKPKHEPQPEQKADDKSKSTSSAKDSSSQNRSSPSILEKGIIYFFFRGRVNTDDPSSVEEVARTFILLRPLSSPSDDLNPDTLPDNLSRLIAVPKKTFPTSGRERWISFVEKTGVSFSDLEDSFLSGDEYETKTRGTRHTPAATPIGEGVYAITTTGRESHLVYLLTIPEELGEVQEEMGLKGRGSFIISTRNPEYPPPGNAGLPDAPEFSEEIKREFGGRRWCPSNPKHLDVEGAQVLLVGESSGIEKATEQKDGEAPGPKEELERLEEEDEERMQGLGKDESESIFRDLHASAKEYPKLKTTF
jgi:hypothetical protein